MRLEVDMIVVLLVNNPFIYYKFARCEISQLTYALRRCTCACAALLRAIFYTSACAILPPQLTYALRVLGQLYHRMRHKSDSTVTRRDQLCFRGVRFRRGLALRVSLTVSYRTETSMSSAVIGFVHDICTCEKKYLA